MSKNEIYQQLNLYVSTFFDSPSIKCIRIYSYTSGSKSFTFAPRLRNNAQSLTINRTTGDITLNRE